jgi:hypothetical protein
MFSKRSFDDAEKEAFSDAGRRFTVPVSWLGESQSTWKVLRFEHIA